MSGMQGVAHSTGGTLRTIISTDTMIIKTLLFSAGLALSSAAGAAPCNKAAAQKVQRGLNEFAKSHIEGDHLAVHWVYAIEKQPATKRLQMITAYADMDACLGGATREIMFYRKGKLMGIASPETGLRLTN